MQDAYGNARDYILGRLDEILVQVAGQEFSVPYSYPSATTALTFATAGNYTVEIWLEAPKLSPRQLIASYILAVDPAAPSALMSKVCNSQDPLPIPLLSLLENQQPAIGLLKANS